MKAVVLAAGLGRRLNSKPKPLMKVGGIEILKRSLTLLSPHVDEFIVVAGKYYDEIKGFLERTRFKCKIIKNEHPEWGNGYSLKLALDHVEGKFILIMGDHVYSEEFIEKAVKGIGLIIDKDPKYVDIDEATKVILRNGRVKEIGKHIGEFHGVDTGFFVLDSSISEKVRKMEDDISVSEIMREIRVPVTEVSGCFWMDVDTPADLRRVNRLLIKESTKKTGDGLVSRYINRKFSTLISSKVVNHVSPNQMTVISFLIGILSALLLFFDLRISAITYQLSSMLDGCDGEIARASLRRSAFGGYIDSILDRIVDFTFLAVLVYLFPSSLVPGLFAIFGTVMVSYSREKLKAELGRETADKILEKRTKYLIGRRDERILITMMLLLLGLIYELMWVLAILTNLRVLATIYLVKKGLENR
jgi:CDP-L-myo-inositol myo-inositolphosphotransferase